MIFTFVLSLTLLFSIYLLFLKVYWEKIEPFQSKQNEDLMSVAILLPVRNESENIRNLLEDISVQEYPQNKIEVILVDDYSEDSTEKIAKEKAKTLGIKLRVISLRDSQIMPGKKSAITSGVEKANAELILCTDGDCRLKPKWISNYAEAFQDTSINMVLGPVIFHNDNNFFSRLQKLEFAGLIGLGASSLEMRMPTMCNGANLGYRKSLFERVQGFVGNKEIASGDDEFLLQKAFDENSESVRFLKSRESIVETPSKASVADFLNQRIRWASKWQFHKQKRVTIWAIMTFIFQVALATLMLYLFDEERFGIGFGILSIKWLAEYFYLRSVSKDLAIKLPKLEFFVLQLVYPFYIVFLSIISLFVTYQWKGRNYK